METYKRKQQEIKSNQIKKSRVEADVCVEAGSTGSSGTPKSAEQIMVNILSRCVVLFNQLTERSISYYLPAAKGGCNDSETNEF